MADVLLIHGTTQGPRGWDRLVAILSARGHRCVAVDLVGRPEWGAGQYVDAIQGQVPGDLASPIVVAHSGAGLLLPTTARALGARRQVWLAAFVPDGRRSLVEEVRAAPTEVFNPEWLGADPTSDPVLAAYFLFHDCDLESLRWALTTLRLFRCERLGAEAVEPAPDIPSTYVVASRDRTLRPEWCRREAVRRLAADLVELDAGHCPHVSRAADLAAILDGLASTKEQPRAGI